jgi:hypothetical protein
MSVKVASNRFIVSSKYAALYQQIFASISDFQTLGQKLVARAEWFQAIRHIEKLEAVAEVLSNIPYRQYQLIGQYYLGWCGYRKGEDTRALFEMVVEESNIYRAKGLISLAGVETAKKDHATAGKFYQEAVRWSQNPSAFVSAAKGIAVFKAVDGDHQGALKDLQALYPVARYSNTKVYYDYLNSLAVEFGEVGRIEEANNVCNIVLASPYAFAYPEWRETGQDLALRGYKSRSLVPIIQSFPGNLLHMPEREPSDTPTPVQSKASRPASVRSLEKWKEQKMVKEPTNDDENIEEMDEKDLFLKLVQVSTQDNITRKQLYEIVRHAIKVTSKKD